ncbi:MAG: VOC family protein [Gammaproteobacteria bacterium]
MSSDTKAPAKIGAIEWRDLTVADAEQVRDFYCSVVGWNTSAVSMGEYDDFNITRPEDGETVAGICHARGGNSELPAQWLMYVRVSDASESAAKCRKLGGAVLVGPKPMGASQFCVIQDPAGAVLALISG